jgi:hypothetical protein
VTSNLDALLTALHGKSDDESAGPRWMGRAPVADRFGTGVSGGGPVAAGVHLRGALAAIRPRASDPDPYLPQQSGYNKRLRDTLGLVKLVIRMPARSGDFRLDYCWTALTDSIS